MSPSPFCSELPCDQSKFHHCRSTVHPFCNFCARQGLRKEKEAKQVSLPSQYKLCIYNWNQPSLASLSLESLWIWGSHIYSQPTTNALFPGKSSSVPHNLVFVQTLVPDTFLGLTYQVLSSQGHVCPSEQSHGVHRRCEFISLDGLTKK